jgi:hypothetical protein
MNPRVNLGRSMNTIYALIIFGMGILASWFLFDGMANQQMERETASIERQLAKCHTGSHCKVAGIEFLTITAKGAGR